MADQLLQKIIDIAGHTNGNARTGAVRAAAVELYAVYTADIINIYRIAVSNFTILDLLRRSIVCHHGINLRLQCLITT